MRKLLAILLLAMLVLALAVPAFATDVYNDGKWKITTDGDLLPIADSSYDIGASGDEVDNVYADSIWVGGAEYTSFAAGTDGNWTDNGLTLTADRAPTKYILTYSTGDMNCTQFTAGSGDIFLENGQKIDGGTNNAVKLVENSDTVTLTFTGDDLSIDNSDGGVIFALTDGTDGTLDIQTNNDTNDYISILTSANVPTIATVGGCNLALDPESGTVAIASSCSIATNLAITGATSMGSTLTLSNSETIANGTNGTVTISGDTANPILYVYDAGVGDSDATLQLGCDAAADNGDVWQVQADGATNSLLFRNNTSGSQATMLTLSTAGLVTTTGDVTVAGTTPLITVGDGGNEDAGITFDGQATKDFYMATDNADDSLIIGVGSTIGTDSRITVQDNATETRIELGDSSPEDCVVVFDGNEQDYYLAVDDPSDAFYLGLGSVVETTPVIGVASSGTITTYYDMVMTGTTPLLTIGDGGNEDAGITFDGQTSKDFYIATDNADDQLLIGYGSTIGTDARIKVNDDAAETKITLGDAATADQVVVFDGNQTDYYMALDYSANALLIGNGATVATEAALQVTSAEGVEVYGTLVADKGINYAADSNTSDDYIVTLVPAPAALTTGMQITFWAKTANTGACTLNVNGLGAKAMKVLHDQDASDNWIEASSMVMCVYDGDTFQIVSPDANP